MIEHIDSLSLVLWGVFFLSAGMYPLGLMLGAPCSPCCGSQCGDPPVEFNRCIRFVNTDTSSPRTSYASGEAVDEPLHGYSRAVTRPEQVGAVRVPTKLELSGGVWISQLARAMPVGEVRAGTYRIYYKSPSGADIGTAVLWTITLQGVAIAGDDAAPTPIVFGEDANGKTATIYSDNAPVQDPAYHGKLIQFPSVEISPSGEQLRSTLVLQAQPIQDLFQAFTGPNLYNIVSARTTKSGWIMRAFDVGGGYIFDGNGHPAQNQWNYNVAEVESFLNGDVTVLYNSGSTSDPTRLQYGPPPSTTWTMQVSEPTAFCGYPLCTRLGYYIVPSGVMYGDAVENTVTVQTAPFPQTYTLTDEKGTTTYTNPCYGLDTPPIVTARLSPFSCAYSGTYSSCENPSSVSNAWTKTRGQPARVFYCGDLLWVIEHGPCRSTLTLSYLDWGAETYTLGGNDGDSWQNSRRCHTSLTQNEGVCMPYEATLTLNQQYPIRCYAGGSLYIGDTLTGDIVCSAVDGAGAAYGIASTGCLLQVFAGVIPFQQAPGQTAYGGNLPLTIVRRRGKWCQPWENDVALYFSSGCFCGLVTGSCAATVPGGAQFFAVINASVSFGSSTAPLSNTISVSPETLHRSGGTVTLTYCCPERQETMTVGPHSGRYDRSFNLESSNSLLPGHGLTGYITQGGYDGEECPFDVIWLSGSTGYTSAYLASEFPGRVFSSDSCPIVGQVSPSEQPECEWSVTASGNWLVVGKTEEGLLKISIDDSVAPVFAQPAYYNNDERPARRANITVASLGTTKSWTIIHIKP